MGLDSLISKMTCYGLDDRGSIPDSGKNLSLRYHVQSGSAAHLTSYPINVRGKAAGT